MMGDDRSNRKPTDYRFEYPHGVIRCGRDSVSELGDELDAQGLDRALVVCGRTIGSKRLIMDAIEDGLDDRHVGTFAETTPDKRLGTAADGARRARDLNADVLVAVGGGSSLDVAKAVAVILASDRSLDDHREQLAEESALDVPATPLPPIVAVPTTLAGADISYLAGISAIVDDETASGIISDIGLMPSALFYDHDLFATTPRDVLAASAMNGFNKGVETLYARTATPITDATATRGLSRFADGLPTLGSDDPDDWDLNAVLDGLVLVQYGITRPDARTTSIIHAFGHGLTTYNDLHQGIGHAVVGPHVLRSLFDNVHGRRDLLATALGVDTDGRTDEETASAVIEAFEEVRDAMGLPEQLRNLDGVHHNTFDNVATAIRNDRVMSNTPEGFDPTVAELRAVLDRAW